jgi:hypothetical protein
MLDDLGRKAMAGIGGGLTRHPVSFARPRHPDHWLPT